MYFLPKFAGVGNLLIEKKKVTLSAILVPNILVLLHFLFEVLAENWLVLVEYKIDFFLQTKFYDNPSSLQINLDELLLVLERKIVIQI